MRKLLWYHASRLVLCFILYTIAFIAYMEIGSSRNWPYTDVWHPRLHHIYHQIGII